MIDLDEGNHQPAQSGAAAHDRLKTRQKIALGLVAVFAVGIGLGGFAVHRRDSLEQRERNGVVALVALPRTASLGSPTFQSSTIDAGSDAPKVKLTGHLILINAGPAPITVRRVAAAKGGLSSSSAGEPRLLPLGGTGQLMVELSFECSVGWFEEPLPLTFEVETADKHVREVSYPVDLAGSDWQRVALPNCEHA
ncbi:hypothetical protein [Micromonospora trifolii]|uniref:hypothetical protein n=1 Tax=Micromonospora trifolii TaxID=2911208 RepID=UPI003CF46592